jgi:hypothetical protein
MPHAPPCGAMIRRTDLPPLWATAGALRLVRRGAQRPSLLVNLAQQRCARRSRAAAHTFAAHERQRISGLAESRSEARSPQGLWHSEVPPTRPRLTSRLPGEATRSQPW